MADDHSPRPIDLALEPAFMLGALEVRPATREVVAGEAREQLEPRVIQVLVALARHRGEVVSRDELLQTCWAGRVVGDDAVHRCIFQLRKLAAHVGGFEIVTVPRVGFRLVEVGADAAKGRRMALWRRPGVAAALGLLALLMAVGGAWTWRQGRLSAGRPGPTRVFVEPARNTVSGSVPAAVTVALTEELKRQVSASGVQTTERESGPADYRLVTAVTAEGSGVRAAMHLLDRRSSARVWSAEVSGSPADAIRRASVVAAAATHCAASVRVPGAGPIGDDGLTAYLRACGLRDDPESATEVFTLLERVTALAPRFAPGHSGLALFAAISSKDVAEPLKTELRRRGRAEVATALRLRPSEGTAFLASEMLTAPRTNWIERQRLLDRGLAVDPENFRLVARQGVILAASGRLSEAAAFYRRAVTLNPFATNPAAELAFTLDARGSLSKARDVIGRAYETWPENPQVLTVMLQVEAAHDPARALRLLADPRIGGRITSTRERFLLGTVLEAQASGSPAQMARARALVAKTVGEGLWPPFAIHLLAAVGDIDDALRIAEAAAQTHTDFEPQYLFGSTAKPMRDDPRFMRVAQKWGLTDYWRQTGHWPDFCRAPSLPYDCRKEAARLAGARG